MKTKITAIILSFILIIAPIFVFAQIQNPLKTGTSIPQLLSTILNGVVRVGAVVAIFMFIYTGFLFVQAQGNPEGLKKAKSAFFNTCIGVAVLLGAQLIASLIVGTINSIKQ